ncbi:MAG: DDE-type integrase/transposase/recombinase [Rhodospirillales bacterium]|nr:DDE-type integrase/transposase/recombinase [Rhodospirillales bacterium]
MLHTEEQITAYRRHILGEARKHGVARTARNYGFSRAAIYLWRKCPVPQKRGPRGFVAWRTDSEREDIVAGLREATNYGPKRIKRELEFFGVHMGEKAIRGILQRKGLIERGLKKDISKGRFFAPYPGFQVQIDTKSVPDPGIDHRSAMRHQYTAIDACTRLRFLWLYRNVSSPNAVRFLKKALTFFAELGISVQSVRTDNHAIFTNERFRKSRTLRHIHPFTRICRKSGIAHLLSQFGTPRHNCFVERSHRIDDEEFYRLLDLRHLDDKALLAKLQVWQYRYNCMRLHSGCNYETPLKRYLSFREQ